MPFQRKLVGLQHKSGPPDCGVFLLIVPDCWHYLKRQLKSVAWSQFMIKLLISLSLPLILAIAPMSFSKPVRMQKAPEYDLVIRNGSVIDGSGKAVFNADVAIKG